MVALSGFRSAGRHSKVYFFTIPAALKTFKDSKGFDVGAGMDLAVANFATSGQISAETLQKPLVIFVWAQQGLWRALCSGSENYEAHQRELNLIVA